MATATKNGAAETVNRIADLDTPAAMRPEIVSFRIIGISPLLQNNPANFIGKTEEAELGTKKVYKDDEEAELRVYRNMDGAFVHPSESFVKAMVRAVTGKKFGKLSAPGVIKGSVFLAEVSCLIEDGKGKPAKAYAIDRRPCVVGKARILRCRPCWSPWAMKLALEVDAAIISRKMVLDALSLAGRVIGIGDYRPEKGGGFGRFRVE
jgi:hypothetical protein